MKINENYSKTKFNLEKFTNLQDVLQPYRAAINPSESIKNIFSSTVKTSAIALIIGGSSASFIATINSINTPVQIALGSLISASMPSLLKTYFAYQVMKNTCELKTFLHQLRLEIFIGHQIKSNYICDVINDPYDNTPIIRPSIERKEWIKKKYCGNESQYGVLENSNSLAFQKLTDDYTDAKILESNNSCIKKNFQVICNKVEECKLEEDIEKKRTLIENIIKLIDELTAYQDNFAAYTQKIDQLCNSCHEEATPFKILIQLKLPSDYADYLKIVFNLKQSIECDDFWLFDVTIPDELKEEIQCTRQFFSSLFKPDSLVQLHYNYNHSYPNFTASPISLEKPNLFKFNTSFFQFAKSLVDQTTPAYHQEKFYFK